MPRGRGVGIHADGEIRSFHLLEHGIENSHAVS